MNLPKNTAAFALAAAFIAAARRQPSAAQAQTPPVPKSTLVPVTEFIPELTKSPPNSFSSARPTVTFSPENLTKLGYVEQEYFCSNGLTCTIGPPTARSRSRRPTLPTPRASASAAPRTCCSAEPVVVEIANPARRFDWDMMWGYLGDEIVRRGDGWVAITTPGAIPGLKTFDPVRYAPMSFANPAPGNCPDGKPAADTEEGLKWDMYSQVGALIKSNDAKGPFGGYRAQAIYMTTQGGDAVTYINAIRHPQAASPEASSYTTDSSPTTQWRRPPVRMRQRAAQERSAPRDSQRRSAGDRDGRAG